MFGMGSQEIFLILLVILIFFGAKKIPELAQGLGKGVREFRKAAKDIQEDMEKDTKLLDDKDQSKNDKHAG
ncbi:MAG: twin-arginine translocase TatA/TatE family subunit [bacterium]